MFEAEDAPLDAQMALASDSGSHIHPQLGSNPNYFFDWSPWPQAVKDVELIPTPAPNTQVLLASGIIVIGVDDWVIKLANVA